QRSVGSLVAVIGLIVLLAWGYRAVANGRGVGLTVGGRAGLIEVVSRTSLSSRHTACLVRIGQRLVLVGVSADRVTPLDVISDPDAVATLLGQAQRDKADSATRQFQENLRAQSREFRDDAVDERVTPEADRVDRARAALSDALSRVRKGLGGG
ncbi:MAG: flagellar biosynthetic protein FliO, partial [Phycisphaerales bacterium]|nr:flagellar biosynthetic protein FliO [Phycisphaerales bacterium]